MAPAQTGPDATASRWMSRRVAIASIFFLSVLIWLFYPSQPNVDPRFSGRPPINWCRCDDSIKNVAIIGAGAGGASAAASIDKLQVGCPSANIDVFERNGYVGGRSTTVHAYNDPSMPVELGGSIFVEVNHMLVNAAKDYHLPVQDYRGSIRGGAEVLGVWDGQQFIFIQSDASYGWWNIVKLLWRYGMSPIRTQNLVKKTVGAFLKMYEPEHFPFESLSEKAFELGLTTSTAMTGSQLLAANGINAAFAHDIAQASTRVNYAQNLDQIHGVETMVSMATDGAMSIQGGNWQIFNSMIENSGATLHLNTSVTEITLLADSNKYALKTVRDSDDAQDPTPISTHSAYDSVILAAPLQFTNITFSPPLANQPPAIPYVSLHVTLFTSPYALSPSAFNLPPDSDVPTMILTTTNSNSSNPIPFNSITLLDILSPPPPFQNSIPAPATTREAEYLYKIFSLQPLNASFITTNFLEIHDKESMGDSTNAITWMYEKRWDGYPYLPPRVTFDGTRLDGKGLWYTSGVEGFISTMETSALMGANVAELVVRSWEGAGGATGVVKEEEKKEKKDEEVEL